MRHWFLIGSLLAASAGQASVHVKSVNLDPGARGWRVSVSATSPARYRLHVFPEPARLIIDIPNATLDIDAKIAPAGAETAPVLRYSQFTRDPDSVRVVVNLPGNASPWKEASSSPASEISVLIPGGAHPKQGSSKERSAGSRVVSRLKHSFGPPAPMGPPAPIGPPEPAVAREQTVAPEPRPRAAKIERSPRTHLASRGGPVDTSDLMEDPAQAPTPAWDPADAVALIREGECPKTLRERLIEVVSDPAIQTSRYVWGAETPGQFDCSGLALYIYQAIGVKLPRCSWQQCEVGEAVDRDSLHPGDLVFFDIKGKGVSHVGIYLGEDRFLHAANPKSNLKITSLDAPFYAARYAGARRVYGGETTNDSLGG